MHHMQWQPFWDHSILYGPVLAKKTEVTLSAVAVSMGGVAQAVLTAQDDVGIRVRPICEGVT